jgi:hypothetical protein
MMPDFRDPLSNSFGSLLSFLKRHGQQIDETGDG